MTITALSLDPTGPDAACTNRHHLDVRALRLSLLPSISTVKSGCTLADPPMRCAETLT